MTKTKDQEIRERVAAIEAEHDGSILKKPVAVRLGVHGAAERHEKKLDVLKAEHATLKAAHAELAAKDLTITPLDGDPPQVDLFRRKLIGKKLERGRLRTLLAHSSPMVAQARATRLREVEGEVAYIEERLRQLTAVEGNR